MFLKFIHVVVCVRTSLFSTAKYSTEWIDYILCTRSSFCGHWGGFYLLPIRNSAPVDTCKFLPGRVFSFLLGRCLGVEFQDIWFLGLIS